MTNESAAADPLRAVAAELGLQPEDTRARAGDFEGGRIRFAGRAAEAEPSDYLLRWIPGEGWQLAADDGRDGVVQVVATLTGTPPPEAVADFVLNALAGRGERLVRRSDEPGAEPVPPGEKDRSPAQPGAKAFRPAGRRP
ncbi:DUF6292 family protein [Amycolatopsis vancoresmycina]|uniref:DUF6292 domain-containing protein n=1 Tax=Amycolatopsis vancoresmycina DSM 44592 TaxID=1292037 RepID=R1FX12_9PSEU|nr:DUF6292 family protein [Amycolatopsis vancoresmycina]EOD63882.1 hypothetical protein H480_34721 [Amycolatopsis vancoresmycina DSM 44592]